MPRFLVFIPTDFELAKLQPMLAECVQRCDGVFATCGFGPIASGIRSMQLLMTHKPESAVLVGIAGAYGTDLPIGTAVSFERFGCYGIGAGSGRSFRTAGDLGWSQLVDQESGVSFGDIIPLPTANQSNEPGNSRAGRMLLTACAASDSTDDVKNRLCRFPEAAAEDMEAFSVAMACQMAGVPLTVIRGISNVAGDRNKANWNVPAALNAAAELFLARFSE